MARFACARPLIAEVNTPVDGKPSLSKYVVVSRDPFEDPNFPKFSTMTTVDLYPITGRMHQLRRHMQTLGHPILGDRKYANYTKSVLYGEHHKLMCLWAVEVDFRHPFTKEKVKVAIDEPDAYRVLRDTFALTTTSPPSKRSKQNVS